MKMAELKSPVSGAVLEEVTVNDVMLHKDPETGGYWLRQGELEALTEAQETPVLEVHTGETLREHKGRFCPEDNTALMEFEFEGHSGVKLDICPTCKGIWLDGGEITKLMEYLNNYEFGSHEEDPIGVTERVLLFLYQLTARPPLY